MGRFSAQQVGTGPDRSPLKTIVTGGPGVGKTWLVSTITDENGGPIFFLPVEEGVKGLCPDARPMGFRDGNRWTAPRTLEEFYDACDAFARDVNAPVDTGDGQKRRPYRHLGIDSLSGLERLVHDKACGIERVRHMEDKDFKKVWSSALPLWEAVQGRLDAIRGTGVNIWLIAHATEAFDASQTTGETFRRWDLLLRGSGKTLEEIRHLWRAWADNVWFVTKDVTVAKGDKTKRAMARLGGRVLVTRETGAVYAKSRLAIPERVAATWPDIQRAIKAGASVKPDKAREQILSVASQLEDEDRASVEADLAAAKSPSQLAAALSRAQGMLALYDRPEDYEDEPTPGDRAASPPPPPPNGTVGGAFLMNAAIMSDEDRLKAIDQGRA